MALAWNGGHVSGTTHSGEAAKLDRGVLTMLCRYFMLFAGVGAGWWLSDWGRRNVYVFAVLELGG